MNFAHFALREEAESNLARELGRLLTPTTLSYKKKTFIYGNDNKPSKGFYSIMAGKALTQARNKFRHKDVFVFETLEAGNIFGYESFLDSDPDQDIPVAAAALCLTSITALFWEANAVYQASLADPRLGIALLRAAAARQMHFVSRVTDMALLKVPNKLAALLVHASDNNGTRRNGTIVIPHMTHNLIAQVIGTNREQVSYLMGLMRKRGTVRYNRSGIQILDYQDLRSRMQA